MSDTETKADIDVEPVQLSRAARTEHERIMLSKSAAARVLGIGRRAVDAGIRTGTLPFVTIGDRTLIPHARARMALGLD